MQNSNQTKSDKEVTILGAARETFCKEFIGKDGFLLRFRTQEEFDAYVDSDR